MFVSTIGTQKTPANPVDVLLGPSLGLPAVPTNVILIAQMGATGGPTGGGTASGTAFPYTAVKMVNVGNVAAASGEAGTKFGNGSFLAQNVIAAVTAVAGGSNFPAITCIPLPAGESPSLNTQAIAALDPLPGIPFVATQFDGGTDTVNRTALINEVATMSGALRTPQGQYGAFAVMANMNVPYNSANLLPTPNSQFFVGVSMYDSGSLGANPYNVGQLAAAAAAILAANGVPFNGLDSVPIPGVTAPANQADWITVGGGLQSEAVLNQGWTPVRILVSGQAAFIRTVTSRIFLSDGMTPVSSYIDVQDFESLYFFRDTVATRFAQPDFQNQKASNQNAKAALGEVIRLEQEFQDQGMFQAVSQLSALTQVQTNPSQRGRFDIYIPVNVVPNLHEIATDVVGTTLFDSFSVGG